MAVGRELVRGTLDMMSVQGVGWCEGGNVMGGDFILCFWK